MKKSIHVFISFFCFLTLSLLACSHTIDRRLHKHNPQTGLPEGRTGRLNPANSERNNSSRLIAYGASTYTGAEYILTDSSAYKYNGSQGYDPLLQSWQFDTATDFTYDTANSTYTANYYFIEYFNAANQDTFYLERRLNQGTWENSSANRYHFNAAGYIDTLTLLSWNTVDSSWVNSSRYISTYDVNNNITQWLYLSWNSGTQSWGNYDIQYYAYDINGNQVIENGLHWNSTTLGWDSSYRSLYTYDNQHDQTSETDQIYDTATVSWGNYEIYLYTGFVAEQPLQNIYLRWNNSGHVFDTLKRWTYTYNSDNHILSYQTEGYTGSAWQLMAGNYQGRYYYESNTAGINSVNATGGTVNIYPVPAKDEVTINGNWKEAQPFTISIYDLQGRIMYQRNVEAESEYRQTISLRSFAAGTYVVKLKGTSGEVVKQLLVAR